MGRPSNRDQRRAEILAAFAQVVAAHGFAGATIARVAERAGVAPGLVHHHFDNKADLLGTLLSDLVQRFRLRTRAEDQAESPLFAYANAALRRGERSDLVEARCWVGVLAEAVRDPKLFAQMRRVLDTEIAAIVRRSGGRFSEQAASAVLAFIIGSFVLGAFAPKRTVGFAAPGLKVLIDALLC